MTDMLKAELMNDTRGGGAVKRRAMYLRLGRCGLAGWVTTPALYGRACIVFGRYGHQYDSL